MSLQTKIVRVRETQGKDGWRRQVDYTLWDTDYTALTEAIVAAAIPAFNATATVGGTTLYCTERDYGPIVDSAKRAWNATVVFNPVVIDSTFTHTSSSFDAIVVPIYRTGASLPVSLSAPAESDIGGTKVDSRGEPVSSLAIVQKLRIRNFKTGFDAATVRAYVGKRNDATFLGASAGYVLFEGAQSERVSPTVDAVDYTFAFDSLAHLRQVAQLEVDGQPKLTTPDGNGVQKASLVYWRQPFPATATMSGLGITL